MAWTTAIAAHIGIETVHAAPGDGYLLVERFDRLIHGDPIQPEGHVERLHQEDICQALGFSGHTKYQVEGGPSLADAASLVRAISSQPAADLLSLIRRHIANILIGNADGHGKNLAMLYSKTGARLAPAYDLVCTRAYEGFTPMMAMATGTQHDPGQIDRRDFEEWAQSIGVSPRLILRSVEELLSEIAAALPAVRDRFAHRWGDHAMLQRIDRIINTQLHRTRLLLVT